MIFLFLFCIEVKKSFIRKYVITEMRKALQQRNISRDFFLPNPEKYLATMSRNYEFVDNLFLMFFAAITQRDIIILPVHPDSALVNKEFTWIFGNNPVFTSFSIF